MDSINNFINLILRYASFFKEFGETLWAWRDTVILVITLIGFVIIILSVFLLLKNRSGQNFSFAAFAGSFFTGVMLLSFKNWINTLTWTAFTDEAESSVLSGSSLGSLTGVDSATPEGSLVIFAVAVIMMAGIFAILKGTLLLKDVSSPNPSQGASMGAVLAYLVSGVISVNVVRFIS